MTTKRQLLSARAICLLRPGRDQHDAALRDRDRFVFDHHRTAAFEDEEDFVAVRVAVRYAFLARLEAGDVGHDGLAADQLFADPLLDGEFDQRLGVGMRDDVGRCHRRFSCLFVLQSILPCPRQLRKPVIR